MDIHRNPILAQDLDGKYHKPDFQNRFGSLASHVVTVDSRDRDRNLHENPNNFVMKLKSPLKNVYSIELLKAIVPIPAGVAGERYAVLRVNSFDVLESAEPKTNVDISDFYNPVSDGAFIQIPLTSDYPGAAVDTALFLRSERRAVKRFFPKIANLNSLEFTLELRGNTTTPTLYPFADEPFPGVVDEDNNVVYEFEIVSQN